MELEDHLFRREAGRMTAVLTRIFGVHNLALAEDVVQDAFCRALETWKLRGAPDNAAAWLMATARRRAIDVLRRERTARTFAPELGRLLESEWTLVPTVEEIVEAQALPDDLLRMMFSCCHPRLSEDVQTALVLNILCGFSVSEIAAAFLCGEAAIHKRIQRGKKVLAGSKRLFDLTGADFASRLSAVQRALYLLFNEGYHGASPEAAVRTELCEEAVRLMRLLVDRQQTSSSSTLALAALMCFHAARLPGRLNKDGHLNALADQDRSRWDPALIDEGRHLLQRAARDGEVTEYHIEAAMAAVHTSAPSAAETDWAQIVALYDALLRFRPSPVIALNRAIAIAQQHGPERGLAAIDAIADRDRLARYPFYFAAIGDLELRRGHQAAARAAFESALALARNDMERQFFGERVQASTPTVGALTDPSDLATH
jgi:RNA polymerase sigma factor (sigma-70 family)